MERLFALRKEIKAEFAKEQFISEMAKLQTALPIIKKLKQGHVAAYAPLEDIIEITGPIVHQHGFTYRWNTKQEGADVTVECIGTHSLGHSESVFMTAPIEEIVTGNSSGKATKSGPQRVASTITFLKRYTYNNLFGVQVGGEDFDGRMQKQRAATAAPKNVRATIMLRLRTLKQDISTKESCEAAVKKLTELELNEKNFDTIVDRLEAIIDENHAN